MAIKLTIKLSGLAEKFINEMKSHDLTEADVISQSIGLLEEVWRTGRVALVKEDFFKNTFEKGNEMLPEYENILDFYYYVLTPDKMKKKQIVSRRGTETIL